MVNSSSTHVNVKHKMINTFKHAYVKLNLMVISTYTLTNIKFNKDQYFHKYIC